MGLGSDDPSVIGIKAMGTVTADAMDRLIERIEGVRASGNKARIYVDLTDYDGYELPVVKEKAELGMVSPNFRGDLGYSTGRNEQGSEPKHEALERREIRGPMLGRTENQQLLLDEHILRHQPARPEQPGEDRDKVNQQ